MNRRRMLGLTTSIFLQSGLSVCRMAVAQDQRNHAQPFVEQQSGDPDLPPQTLTIDLDRIAPLLDVGKSIGIKKDPHKLADRALEISIRDAEENPHPDDARVEEYLKLFGIPVRDANGHLQPFCAAGLSHVFCRAYCELEPEKLEYPRDEVRVTTRLRILRDVLSDISNFYFLPHCSTQQMVAAAKLRKTWIQRSTSSIPVNPGTLVFFNWADKKGSRSGIPNHVGLVERAESDHLRTVEYNTSITNAGSQREGGHIARKSREYDDVLGYVFYSG